MMKKSNAHSLALLQSTRPVMLIERNTRFLLRLCVICDAIVFTHKKKSGRKSNHVAFVVIATLHRDDVKEKGNIYKMREATEWTVSRKDLYRTVSVKEIGWSVPPFL